MHSSRPDGSEPTNRSQSGTRRLLRTPLDQVDDLFEAGGDGGLEPEWVYWVSREEVSVMRVRVMVELQRPREAEELLTDVLTRYPTDLARESALYWSWLAEAYAAAGDYDAARTALGTAGEHASLIHSARANDHLTAVGALIAGQ